MRTTPSDGWRQLGFCAWLAFVLAAAASADDASVSAKLASDRMRPYEKEPFTLTLTIEATGVQLSQAMEMSPGPEAGSIAMESFKELPGQQVPRDGTVVTRRSFRVQATGLKPGQVRVAPVLQVRLMLRRPGLFGSFWEERPLRVDVQPLDLQVLPVPTEGRPAGWSGAIGRFDFQAEAAPREVAAGELVKVHMAISGKGYTANLRTPRLEEGAGFKVYEPTALPGGDSRLEFEQVVVPLTTNAAAVPAVSFCYFDTAGNRFATLTRGPFPLKFHARRAVTADVYRPAAEPHAPAARTELVPQSPRQWLARGGTTALTVLAALSAMAAIQGGLRRRWIAAALSLAAAALCSGGAVAVHRATALAQPGSVMTRDAAARIAPCDRALETFPLAQGTGVTRVDQTSDGWVCVRRGGDVGWVPADAVGAAQ